MADIQAIKDLALHALQGTTPAANFTTQDVNEAFRTELKSLAGSINQFMKNRYDIYDIITEPVNQVLPQRIYEAIGMFAEIKAVDNGSTVRFKRPTGRMRARQFLTQVGVSGVYEAFRLDTEYFNVTTTARGGAATLDFERLLAGDESLADYMDALTDAMTIATFKEIQNALRAAINQTGVPTKNKVTVNAFDAEKMVELCSVVDTYGQAAIFATPEFVAKMGADIIVPVSNGMPGVSASDLEDIRNTGFIKIFRGHPVIVLPQSFEDETNTNTVMDPQMAYVLPTGNEKVVKVVFEGEQQIYDWINKDNSLEVNTYRKIGVAILAYNNWGIYKNSGITQTYVA